MMEYVAVETQRELLGTVVISKNGRDAGRPYVVTGWLPDVYALVADGKRRKTCNPKKKNIKHLRFTQCRHGGLHDKLVNGEQITDRMIREELTAYAAVTGEGRLNG